MNSSLARQVSLLVFSSVFTAVSSSYAASVAPVAAEHGMVVTAQRLATEVGVDVLKKGGNAVDAAVAVAYALAVVYPAAGNLGGGGFMTITLADGRKTFVDFREKAPLAATANMYLDAQGNIIPGLSQRGHLAVAVPGTVAGMELALKKYGTVKRAELIAPAIQLARQGYVLQQGDVDMLETATEGFKQDAASAAIFLNHGEPYQPGQKLIQKDLANTLSAISARGADGFYKGAVGRAIVESSRRGKGIITQVDLDQYSARELKPIECNYRGLQIISAPPPSSGGVVICEMLNILEGYPLKDWGFRSAKAVHVQIEAMRRAYLDRNNYLGDPDFVKNPVEHLIDKAYATTVRNSINMDKAAVSSELHPGTVAHEGSNTTHYSIVDKDGNAVSVTYTLNNWFGAEVTAASTGVLLNDEMDDFTSKIGEANMYQLVQGEANAIAPGKRPLSSMTPTMVLRDGKLLMVLGTPGGSRIPTTVFHTMINVIDYGMDIQEAVDATRFHMQWMPDLTFVEPFGLSPDTQAILVGMGHHFKQSRPANHIEAILVGAPTLNGTPVGNNKYYGANDPRRNTGLAAGY